MAYQAVTNPRPARRGPANSWNSVPRMNQPSAFLRLPAELRNMIYHYVFYPTVCEDFLIPSSSDLSNLSFLYTCRQIHREAHLLAYGVIFSVTNRWHRDDLEDMYSHFKSRPDFSFYPITKLELASQWRQAHETAQGTTLFLDTFTDYARFVWDMLHIFEQIEELVINSEHKPWIFAARLCYVMAMECQGAFPAEGGCHPESKFWGVMDTNNSAAFKMVGKAARPGRLVTLSAKAVEYGRDTTRMFEYMAANSETPIIMTKLWESQLQRLLEKLR